MASPPQRLCRLALLALLLCACEAPPPEQPARPEPTDTSSPSAGAGEARSPEPDLRAAEPPPPPPTPVGPVRVDLLALTDLATPDAPLHEAERRRFHGLRVATSGRSGLVTVADGHALYALRVSESGQVTRHGRLALAPDVYTASEGCGLWSVGEGGRYSWIGLREPAGMPRGLFRITITGDGELRGAPLPLPEGWRPARSVGSTCLAWGRGETSAVLLALTLRDEASGRIERAVGLLRYNAAGQLDASRVLLPRGLAVAPTWSRVGGWASARVDGGGVVAWRLGEDEPEPRRWSGAEHGILGRLEGRTGLFDAARLEEAPREGPFPAEALRWRPLEAGAEVERLGDLVPGSWAAPASLGGARGEPSWLLVVPPIPHALPQKLAALITARSPAEPVAALTEPVTAAAIAPWGGQDVWLVGLGEQLPEPDTPRASWLEMTWATGDGWQK